MTDNEKKALKELQDLLANTPLNSGQQFGLTYAIATKNKNKLQDNCKTMSNFLKENPNATDEEIHTYAFKILEIDIDED